ncbi:ribonuclease H1-like [Belonocnema kinseyi]|uniref:ribonuclease H1-like n=1 Tax=Belonocnema kinseyi TaxID=2817044 RepID=UPI00143D9AD4|nr:ribonuclease H1-like [Belonocnema kinseyi]
MDGSRRERVSGTGFYDSARRREVVVALGRHATILQAEVHAVLRCAEILLEENAVGRKITICSDSQATLTAVGKPDITSQLVWECKKALNKLAEKSEVAFIWVPGHTGIKGNGKADQLLRIGAAGEYIGPKKVLGQAFCCIGLTIKSWIRTKHREY